MERLFEFMQRQLDNVELGYRRSIYDTIAWDNHMLGLVGPRGVGKTTLFLQRIRSSHSLDDTLYVSADHMYFSDHTLFDTADAFVKNGGSFLFIDEVHKYPNWSREFKMMYDALPNLHVYFTGSSVLDIEKGEADLSRRAPKYVMQGLSFREYLAIRHGIEIKPQTLEEILTHQIRVSGIEHPLPLFRDYLRRGYYPFGADEDFSIELNQVITRTLEVDIPQYAGMTTATGRKLKRLMATVSTLAPFKPNMAQLGSKLGISRNNVEDYLLYLEKAGMIAQLKTDAHGLGALGKPDKVYLDNTNILYCLSDGSEDIGNVRETFFFNQTCVKNLVTTSSLADFLIDGMTFEVGGRNKGQRHIRDAEKGYVVKDDIEYGYGNVIPLWMFGMTY